MINVHKWREDTGSFNRKQLSYLKKLNKHSNFVLEHWYTAETIGTIIICKILELNLHAVLIFNLISAPHQNNCPLSTTFQIPYKI